MNEVSEFKNFLHDIITQAGNITLDYRDKLSTLSIKMKSQKDLVTEADVATEKYLIDRIKDAYPDHAVLGEESGSHAGNEYRWIIDPIDGTTSFTRKQPFYSISVALEKDHETIVAAVNAPVLGELFEAQKNCGATLNGESIRVSEETELIDSVLATGFACIRANLEHDNIPYFANIVRKIRGIRRFGSAAIDLSYVACGRLEGFWEMHLNIYDIAAGMLILNEAGGKVTDFHAKQKDLPQRVVATNGRIHDELIEIIRQTENPSS